MLTCRGPDTLERSVAAHQLAACVALLRHPYATDAVSNLLSPLLAAFSDPAPFVQVCATGALTHLCEHATAASLYWQRDILTHAVSRCMTGSDANVWPAVLPCAFALAARLDSVDGGAARLLEAMQLAMAEAKRSGHIEATRRPFLKCLCQDLPGALPSGSPLKRLGVRVVGLFRELMPMLLDWLQLENEEGVIVISQVCRSHCIHAASCMLQQLLLSNCFRMACSFKSNNFACLTTLENGVQVLIQVWAVAAPRMNAHADIIAAELRAACARLHVKADGSTSDGTSWPEACKHEAADDTRSFKAVHDLLLKAACTTVQ